VSRHHQSVKSASLVAIASVLAQSRRERRAENGNYYGHFHNRLIPCRAVFFLLFYSAVVLPMEIRNHLSSVAAEFATMSLMIRVDMVLSKVLGEAIVSNS
jgi:hypothetical protein